MTAEGSGLHSAQDANHAKSNRWPVIVGIIIGSVIVLAVLACVVNCLCCGYQCCMGCCGCLSCCCPSGRRRNKQPKYYDDPPFHQPPPPAPNPTYQASPAPPVYRGAVQTATFDNSKSPAAKVDEDALPAMPTWAGATDKRIEDHNSHPEDVEMEPLNPQGQVPDRKQGAGTPLSHGSAYADYPPDRGTPVAGYRGFNPTDPYARRSPGPAAALAATQDPYGRRSPGVTSPVDPYGRRSPGLASPTPAVDPYGRRSPGPAAAYAGAQDPYGRRSPGLTSPVPFDHQQYHQPYNDYTNGNGVGAGNNYHGLTSPSPVAAYKPPTTYSPVPMSFSPATEPGQGPTRGFQRQPSFGSSQYPPTYTSQPAYRGVSPSMPSSPPPPAQAPSSGEYMAYQPHEYGMAVGEPGRDRTPSLLQSGRKPAPNTFRDF